MALISMAKGKLPNYLRLQRKRLGFSEREIAFLLGRKGSSQVSRYEHFHQVPPLETAIAYHVIYRTAPPELFGGSYDRIAREIQNRARRLLKKIENPPKQGVAAWKKKVEWLRLLTGENENQP